VNGALKLTLGLAVFVVALGAVLWLATDRAYFAVFIALGLMTGAGAWVTGRHLPPADRPGSSSTGGNP
jgi:hypothetical protein